jgi:alpha-tubulin suppressor-like RCC1 family protein
MLFLLSMIIALSPGFSSDTLPWRFRTISAGWDHTCLLDSEGIAYCWGDDTDGQLGAGTGRRETCSFGEDKSPCRTNPVRVATLVRFAGLSAGGAFHHAHTCAVTADGRLFCWGSNLSGQLGNPRTEMRFAAPVQVQTDIAFATVSAGGSHTCGLDRKGSAFCWGNNSKGQLGDGSRKARSFPVSVTGQLTFSSIDAGEEHTCGVSRQGRVYCWGSDDYGKLGDGEEEMMRSSPSPVGGGALEFVSVSAGPQLTCGVTVEGSVYCWGVEASCASICSSKTNPEPAKLGGLSRFLGVSSGSSHNCAVGPSGVVACWGDGDRGQLGIGAEDITDTPVGVAGRLTYRQVAAGGDHTCAITREHEVYCWGMGYMGQLGSGAVPQRDSPVAVQWPQEARD